MSLRPIDNPPNPWATTEVEYLEAPPPARLQLFEETAKSILSENTSPDLGMRWSVNPYRGCLHACAYCYARPSHQYLGFGAGTDFDRKIVVKVNAPELLREAFDRRSWSGDEITFSGNTDCYQPIEASYRLTRRCLEVCLAYRNPVTIITKGSLVRRDASLLSQLARGASAFVTVTVTFLDDDLGRSIEPGASDVSARFETIRRLACEGVPVGVNVSPIIPGLNDHQVAEILERAAAAGATRAFLSPIRLAAEVAPVFLARLAESHPLRASKVENAIRELRGGTLNDPRFGVRMTGVGPRWEATQQLFRATCRRLGIVARGDADLGTPSEREPTFRRPRSQLGLFEER